MKAKKYLIVKAKNDWPGLVTWMNRSKFIKQSGSAICWRKRSFDSLKEKSIFLG